MIRAVAFILGLAVCGYGHAANDKAFFWQVATDHATVYLMGSIHFADKTFYPLREEIEAAFDRSDYLVVEIDINKVDHDAYLELLSQSGTYKDPITIGDVISEQTLLQLRQRLRHLNIDYEAVKKYKPGVLVLTLSAAQVVQMGFDPGLGIDAYFLSRVISKDAQKQSPKKIIELETFEQQLQLFLGIPNGDLLLKESLYSLDEAELLMAEMVDYWKSGNLQQMNRMLFEDALEEYPVFSEIYDRLFYARNDNMVSKIDAMLNNRLSGGSKRKNNYFVVVGSGHLIGERGIVQALEKKGYQVDRL